MKNARDTFLDIIADNRRMEQKVSILYVLQMLQVLEACFLQAREDDSILLIESTSNQVDQYGGYTGMTPADFVGIC